MERRNGGDSEKVEAGRREEKEGGKEGGKEGKEEGRGRRKGGEGEEY